MSKKIVNIPTTGDLAFIGAAAYLAVIAYPDNDQRKTDFVNACKAWLFIQLGKGRMPKSITKPTILRFSKTRAIQAEFSRVIKRIEHKRMPSLFLAKCMLIKQVRQVSVKKDDRPNTRKESRKFAKPITLVMKDGKPLTINRWLQANYPSTTISKGEKGKIIRDDAEFRAKNFHAREWKESKPVLHLMWALENYLERTGKMLIIEDLLWDASWVAETVSEAEGMRLDLFKIVQAILKADEKWFDSKRMIRLLPEEELKQKCKS